MKVAAALIFLAVACRVAWAWWPRATDEHGPTYGAQFINDRWENDGE